MKYEVTVNGQVYEVTLRELAEGESVTTTSPIPAPPVTKPLNLQRGMSLRHLWLERF